VSVIGVVFLLIATPSSVLRGGSAPDGAASGASVETETAKAPAVPIKPFTFDPNRFDVSTFFPHAEARARNHYADAKLVLFSATGVKPDGTINLTDDDGVATFLFRSEKASRNVGESGGAGGPRLGACTVSVSATESGISDSPVPLGDCGMAITGPPHCSLKHILTKAGAAKKTATVTFNAFGPNGRMWVVIFDEEESQHILPDDC
jgi:hypothetical protein